MPHSRSIFAVVTVATILLPLVGCNQDNPTKTVVGEVLFDGTPVASGEVRFVPTDPSAGKIGSARIENGTYSVDGTQSLLPGNYKVQVLGYSNPNGDDADINFGDPSAQYTQYVPAKYNTYTELTVDIPTDAEASIEHDFDLSK